MNFYFVAAAVLVVGIGIAHSWLGERYILMRLFRRPNIPHLFGSDDFTKRTLRFAWHITTVAWLGAAGLLLILASYPMDDSARMFSRVIAAAFFVSSIIAVVGSRGRHLSWIVFLLIAVLISMGT
jgi:hypothetical protein